MANKPSKNQRTIRNLTNALIILSAIFVVAFHYQGRKLNNYEAHFVALSIKSSNLYLETLRQKVDWLTVLTEHDIVDPVELETAQNIYRKAADEERLKREVWRARYGY